MLTRTEAKKRKCPYLVSGFLSSGCSLDVFEANKSRFLCIAERCPKWRDDYGNDHCPFLGKKKGAVCLKDKGLEGCDECPERYGSCG